MSQSLISVAAIKVKSEELQIPFANLALAFVIEEFFIRVSESEFAPYLWIGNPGSYGLEHYKRRLVEGPQFYYQKNPALRAKDGIVPGQVWSREVAEEMMRVLCASDEKQGLAWEYRIAENGFQDSIEVTAYLENMRIPFQIKIDLPDKEKLSPYSVNFRLFMRNNGQLKLNAYPVEVMAVDCMFEIMEKLELINDMCCYQKLYTILKRETLDGRKIQLQFSEKCKEKGITVNRQKLSTLTGYRSYSYMKKKWKAYLKRENRQYPTWEEVLDLLEVFLSPIWEMMCLDMIFIGDWMPELGRFLE